MSEPIFRPGACAEICSHCGYEKPIGGHCICQVERKEMLEIKSPSMYILTRNQQREIVHYFGTEN